MVRGSGVFHRSYQIGISEPPISPSWHGRMATGGSSPLAHSLWS